MQETDNSTENLNESKEKPAKTSRRIYIKSAAIFASLIILLLGSYVGYVFASSPGVIRDPKLEHYHFRMQVLVNGKAEDFGTKGYQTGYAKDQCNANLPEQPIHFHDNKDQFVHIHWEGMTGGMVMKYYGWNYIGGMDNALGYKLDKLSDPQKVTTHGNYLPSIPEDSKFFVYSGNVGEYKERKFDDWKNQDLEQFFNTTSNFPAHNMNKQQTSNIQDKIFPKAYAHGTADDADGNDSENTTTTVQGAASDQEELKRINNLVGNVVIFVQKDKPTDQQIKDRFNQLEPLSDSTCGG